MDQGAPREAGGMPFGRYLLRELMARGGMGEVFRAVAVGAGGFEKPVVVKRILPQLGQNAAVSEMFVDEARLMSRLVHPNIVQVIDFGRGEGNDYFLVMELVDGVDLRAFCESYHACGERVPLPLAAFIAMQMLRGLAHAHARAYGDGRTLVHRDVSPGNVLLSTVGEVKVADFGVALVAQPEADAQRTLAGKLGYMAPEQHRGAAVDARADVFSAGVVLFLMISGQMPFEGATADERQRNADAGSVRSVRALCPDLGEDFEAVLLQALAAAPDERFASARAMARAIEAACAAEGVAIATSDDLADCVETAAAARARPKPVLALGADGVHELTRTEGAGVFTMRVTLGPTTSTGSPEGATHEPETELSDAVDLRPMREAPHRRTLLVGLGVAAALALGIYALTGDRSAHETLAGASASAPSASSQPEAEGKGMADAEGTATREGAPPEPSTSAGANTTSAKEAPPALSVRPTARSSASATAPPPEPPVPPAPPSGGCHGSVLLAGKGSWWVSGGPNGPVQAPGAYDWPCNSYTLSGKSRMDGRVVSRGIVVRDGGQASARFE